MIQTRLLLSLIGLLCFLFIIAGVARLTDGTRKDEIEQTAKLCSAYFQYADTTRKVIDSLDKMCWR